MWEVELGKRGLPSALTACVPDDFEVAILQRWFPRVCSSTPAVINPCSLVRVPEKARQENKNKNNQIQL